MSLHSSKTDLLLATFLLSVILLQPVAGVSLNKNVTFEGHCVVVLEHNEILKEIGSVWVSSLDPCAKHTCETDEIGRPTETISVQDCGQFYCEVDSELHPDPSTCCGICIRTKCLFNDTAYAVGESWPNQHDCTQLECTQLPGGQPMINAYEKNCPPLPPDCAIGRIYERDCCAYCGELTAPESRANDESDPEVVETQEEEEVPDIWTAEHYRNHPCVRECRTGEPPMTCRYKFVVEWYQTMSKACYDCPHNMTDCTRAHCIAADGISRSITVVNRMMPGPAIEVCENDLLVVDVKNGLLGESTTIHWHGLHQRQTPYMDGVPHISQCPISPHATFRYSFRADNVGTHFWHSHTGMQRGDGVYGALIVRRPKLADPHGHLYDFDLSDHTMLVQDWVHETGVSMFASHHHSRGDNKPMNLLMNGKGRYYKAIWEALKQEARLSKNGLGTERVTNEHKTSTQSTTSSTTELNFQTEQTTASPHVESETVVNLDAQLTGNIENETELNLLGENSTDYEFQTELPDEFVELMQDDAVENDTQMRLQRPNEISRLPRTLSESNFTTKHPTSKRSKHAILADPLDQMPLQEFQVTRGFRYRFRIINAEFLNCPIVVSIDGHNLTALNSDGYDFEPVEVGSIVTYAGERFDFVVNANQPVGNYWIRLKGLMDCSEKFTSAFQVGILRYVGAAQNEEPSAALGYQHKAEGIELNVMNRGPGFADSLTIAELRALPHYDRVPGIDHDALKPVADYKFFVYYDFYAKNNPVFHPADYYGFNDSVDAANRLFTPQLNHISLKFPAPALLPSRDEIDQSLFCNESSLAAQGIDCRTQFCKCHHVLQVPLNAVVELIVVDEGFTFDANHPFHLHGNAFRVVGLERLGENMTIEMVKQLDSYNLLKRNLVRPPVKDTVTVPDGGYTILRFEAYNPGFWLFHCHIEFHAEIGMALVLKVGDNDQMLPVPKNFPTCSDFMPDIKASEHESMETESGEMELTTESNHNAAYKVMVPALWSLILIVVSSIIKIS